MIKVNVFFTTSKLILKNLILNESKTFIIGKVQNKNSKTEYISTKWEINRETNICTCVLNDSDYNFSIKGIYVSGISPEKPVKNFYTFSKDAWHCKLYKWVYGKEPHKVHPTMCPYFWSLVTTFLFFPLVLVIKLFGNTGTVLLKNLESYKRDKRAKARKIFISRCNNVDLSLKEAYSLVKSSCWSDYSWDLDYDVRENISIKHWEYRDSIDESKRQNKLKTQKKITEIKENKNFIYLAYTVSILVFSSLAYLIYKMFSSIEYSPVDWDLLKAVSVFVIKVVSTIGLLTLLLIYVIKPLFKYFQCVELPKCKLCQLGLGRYILMPFKFIGKGILLICDMIYMTYKKACPIITWKND